VPNKKIDKILDLKPHDISDSETTELVEIEEKVNPIDLDHDDAQLRIDYIIDVTTETVQQLKEIAETTQHARNYEALNAAINTLRMAAADKLHMRKLAMKMKREESGEDTGTPHTAIQQNIVFNGSTADLLKQLRDIKNDE
jgi:hypothetical protein